MVVVNDTGETDADAVPRDSAVAPEPGDLSPISKHVNPLSRSQPVDVPSGSAPSLPLVSPARRSSAAQFDLRRSHPLPGRTDCQVDAMRFVKDRWRDQKRIEELDETVRVLEGDLNKARLAWTELEDQLTAKVSKLESANAELVKANLELQTDGATLRRSLSDANARVGELENALFESHAFSKAVLQNVAALTTRMKQLEMVTLDLSRRNAELVDVNASLHQQQHQRRTLFQEATRSWPQQQAF